MANGDIRIEWNHAGFQAVLCSGEVTAQVNSFGQKYLAKANASLKSAPGYGGAAHGAGRSRYNVYTRSGAAKRDNSARNTLAKLMP